jgi:hypothetical protein
VEFLHQPAAPFDLEKCRVSFVHVTDCGLFAECVEGAASADSENDLLFDPHFFIAAVQLIGDVLIFL